MERKEFLKRGFTTALSMAAIAPIMKACSKNADSGSTDNTSGSCTDTPEETEGPYPTHTPSSLVTSDITSDRKGVPLSINITVNNSNASCAALANAIVDIWHCDADGNYSEYGSTQMQSSDYTSVHFLRGRQTTNTSGLVTFTSIFPGWYQGRATHIHVHIYSADGTSLLVTQIAFPADVCNTVYTTATTYYTKGTQDTSNAEDDIFRDSLAYELATVEGNITNGYTLTHLITVAA
ncbi:dioxygenase family protein [Parafilimonas terrae]|uniref:Protocatechuate 3,4-dioxygenase beta subunit n=1 Tax=Parafilimonas terrae TaxID=1465490 RepID=A0A1I5VRS1_9BACT|nr:intradiol ring-cleavage dioxygenase [Parafilimonas terrae]SFQ10274.1 Protocatechuate 3,4-dioxygenase beta subunit [Parafilimonas terrae]